MCQALQGDYSQGEEALGNKRRYPHSSITPLPAYSRALFASLNGRII